MANYEKVKEYLNSLDVNIVKEDKDNELFVVSNKRMGISELVIDCEAPIVILEQFIFDLDDNKKQNSHILLRLLQMNRNLVHGAFVVDEEAKKVIFRDTLQLENLDLNELKGSIDALSIEMVENLDEIIDFSK